MCRKTISTGLALAFTNLGLLSGCSTPATVPAHPVAATVVTASQLQYALSNAASRHDYRSAAQTLTTLAAQFPSSVSAVSDDEVLAVARGAPADADGEPRRALLEALFRVAWKPTSGVEPSAQWLQLAYVRLANQDLAGARAAAARITSPLVLIRLYADRRSDMLVDRNAATAAVTLDAQLEVEQFRQATLRNPRSLNAVEELSLALRIDQRYADSILITTAALRAVADAAQRHAPAPYDDVDQLPWILDEEASGLWNLGRFEDATKVMEFARQLPELGGPNVSQRFNLAAVYCHIGNPVKALDLLRDPGPVSPYGMMVLQSIRLNAAVQTEDQGGAAAALEYLRQHEDDAPNTAIEGFVDAGDLPDADALMRKVLANPDLRGDLLLQLQGFAEEGLTPLQQRQKAQWQEWSSRPEVLTEVAKWGYVDRYPVMQSN